ncbi:cytochrome P450 [Aureobasidium subglaciale]|nr:cytochrome P450 [Aureobasidium subglaciale]
MTLIWKLLITVSVLRITRFAFTFCRNIKNARRVGVTVKVLPVEQENVIWLVLSPWIRQITSLLLPNRVFKKLNLAIFGWEFGEKRRPFDQLGSNVGSINDNSYILAGLSTIEFWTIDPEAIQDILHRTHAFEVPRALEFALGQFGPNVMTTNGGVWARHRRIISSVIDERIFKVVFGESVRQSLELLSTLSDGSSPSGDPKLFDMLKKITIHVLMAAGMGQELSQQDDKHIVSESGYTMSSIDALTTVVTNLIGLVMLPSTLLVNWPRWLPWHEKITKVGHAKLEVRKRNRLMLEEQRERQSKLDKSDANIISKLVHASTNTTSGQSLSEDEMVSNLFIFTAAGYETTATTLAYAMVLLARHSCWQDWIFEEIQASLSKTSAVAWDYADIFPRANRIMAFMLEIVRLYPPAPNIHREISSPQTLQTSSGVLHLRAHTRVYIDSVAVHLLPSWRNVNRCSDPPTYDSDPEIPDELTFRPSRWINPPGSGSAILRPQKGTFVPWAAGPRVCPGQKMAQVEFAAVLMTILRERRVEATPLEGERQSDVMARLDKRLDNSVWRTVLEMEDIFDPRPGRGLDMRLVQRE